MTADVVTHAVSFMKRVAPVALAAMAQLTLVGQEPARSLPEIAAIGALAFRNIGPANQAGRVSVIVGVPGDPYTMYVAGANGGVFKTTNGGTTWTALFDNQDLLSIGEVAIAPSNANVIYVGTGEGNPRNDASFGNGVYRSNDGGETWMHVGLEDTDRIARIRIDDKNADIAYVCAMGHEWGPNEQRGVFKTVDGGQHWTKALYRDQDTGCSDIDINPTNSDEVYAGLYTYRRQAWHLRSGGGETALYKSTDGGATWHKLDNGIPKTLDRIGVSISRSEPATVYMVSETLNYEGELWRSDDSGATWRVVNKDPNIDTRPFYYSDVHVDPNNSNRLFSLAGSLFLSEDGGRTFSAIGRDVHPDHQALWIDPKDSRRVLSGSDGGFQVSADGGKTFNVLNNIAFTQFYHIDFDMQRPYMLCGGLQDNGTWCGPSNSLSTEGIRKNDWYVVGPGDGLFAVPDMKEPWRVYNNYQGGAISVIDVRSGTSRSIVPYPNRFGSSGDAIANHRHRFNWNSPIALGPDGTTVYLGGEVLFKSTTHGQSWDIISPDLTTNDKSKQQSSGEPVVIDNTAAEFHCTILTIAPSPLDPNVIWVGTDDGNVQITRDGGKTWANVVKNIPGLAPNAWIPTIEASPHDAGTAFVAADHHQEDDYTAYFFKTADYGKTWTRLSLGVPAVKTGWSHVIRQDPSNSALLYAGTELGLWVSFDGGARWASLRQNMPSVPVRDIKIHPRDHDLIVATHGRGLYVLDDVTPLERIADAMATETELFDIRPATRWTVWNKDGNLGQAVWKAANPPNGAIISYYLKTEQKSDVVLSIMDGSGKEVRAMRGPAHAGVNRIVWDLRYDGPRMVGGAIEPSDDNPYRFGGGPWVVPGRYTVQLQVGGHAFMTNVQVDIDRRVPVSTGDLQAQLGAGLQLRELTTRVNAAIARTNSLVQQLGALQDRLNRSRPEASTTSTPGDGKTTTSGATTPAPTGSSADLPRMVTAALDAVKTLRDGDLTRPVPTMDYRQYPRLSEEIRGLYGAVSRTAAAPTDGQVLRLKELAQEVDEAFAHLNKIETEYVGRINEMMKGMPFITSAPVR